jgi:phage shock protein A
MPDIDFIRADIEHRRRQVARLRSEIRQLQHSGISSASAELLERMLNKIDELCAERDLKKERPGHNKGKALGGRQW